MTLTAYNTVGFERSYNKSGFTANPILYEGATATTYTEGTLVGMTNGLLSSLTTTTTPDQTAPIVGVVAETKVTTDSDKHVKVDPIVGEVFTVSFTGHADVTASAASTVANRFHTSLASNSSLAIGSLIHIYEGPGKGDTKVISGGSTASDYFEVSGAFSANPSTASKAVITATISTALAVGAGAKVGGQLKIAPGAKKAHVTPPTFAEGYINVINIDPANLKMDVMIAPAKTAVQLGNTSTA